MHVEPHQPSGIRQRLSGLFASLQSGLHERGPAVRYCLLAAIAGESVFLLGPPGVAKSLLARRLQDAFAGARCFDYLMGRFSTPEEIFGPVSIKRLKDEDLYVRQVDDYLPGADIVFLDEIWKAGPPIQNALLTALNEKVYRNGSDEIKLPLKLLIGASNETAPDDAALAFWDRFLIRLELGPLRDRAAFRAMVADTSDPYADSVAPGERIGPEEWREWQQAAGRLPMGSDALDIMDGLREALHRRHAAGEGPYVSDRRWKKLAGVLRAAAFCHGLAEVGPLECFVMEQCLWNRREDRALVAAELREAIGRSAFTGENRLAELQQVLDGIRQDFRGATRQRIERMRRQAELADGEYYVLEAGPRSRRREADAGDELRIWKPDFDTLPADDAPPRGCELFRYRQGQYQGTAAHDCNRSGEWEMLVDGEAFSLRCTESLVVEESYREPDRNAWLAWEGRLEGFQAACRAEAARIAGLLEELGRRIAVHYFLPDDAQEWLCRGLRSCLVHLADLEAAAAGCFDAHDEC